jgi:hypothetical protein
MQNMHKNMQNMSNSSGILYTWYMVVQGSMFWYIPVRTLLATWRYEIRNENFKMVRTSMY